MTEQILGAPGILPISADELPAGRLQGLVAAIHRNRDFSLISIHRDGSCKRTWRHALLVDVECHELPSKVQHGIRFRERIAILVPESGKHLPDVRVLRSDFPRLMHMSLVRRGEPGSLCLYFAPERTVLRDWTPEKFLKRIQWWFVSSAKGTLHASDQPVEQPFFASQYELVLPWNFATLLAEPATRFVPILRQKTPEGKGTFLLRAASVDHAPAQNRSSLFLFTLPSVTQGVIYEHPGTLGELAEVLSARGFCLLSALKTELTNRMSDGGVSASGDEEFTIILLRIPVRRDEEGQPESIQEKAFMAMVGSRQLGKDTGAYFSHEGKIFRYTPIASSSSQPQENDTSWREHCLLTMDILRFNTPEEARRQAGIQDDGPSGTLIGAGSLGSAMLDMWVRSGWGKWTVIDHDHIKPHNLSRHLAIAEQVGLPKAEAIRTLLLCATDHACTLEALEADACTTSNKELETALSERTLVVDCSTTLDYPRMASLRKEHARHVSAFLTPGGGDSVLLAEDQARTIPLVSLEAQYYRAVINENWGASHLSGHTATYWSGAGCRDISVVMPYWRVLGHAGRMAEQVRKVYLQAVASILIWRTDPDTGASEAIRLEPHGMVTRPFGDLTLFLDEGLIEKLRLMRKLGLPNETGGVLLGYFDFHIQAVVLVDALPAPPDSRSSPNGFERGIEGLKAAIGEAHRRTSMVVDYVGEWHSHPPGTSTAPSGADAVQLEYLASNMKDDGLPAVQLIVGDDEITTIRG